MQAFEPGLSLIIGAPRHTLGELLIERIVAEGRPVVVLLEEGEIARARSITRHLERAGTRARLLVGNPSAIDLGVSGPEYLALSRALREVHHFIGPPKPRAARRHEEPTRAVRESLQLVEGAPSLERITFWSSVFASGKRDGSLREAPFSNANANSPEASSRSTGRADSLASEARTRLPVTVLRTGTIVLEPLQTTEESLGAARLLVLYLLSRGRDPLLVMPGRADGVLSFLPADYAVTAGLAIARDPRGAHGIFHLVDSDPPTVRRAISILCGLTGQDAPRLFVPSLGASALLRAPGLSPQVEKLRALLDELGSRLEVSDFEARTILEPLGIVCPAFESYAERLVEEVRDQMHDARLHAGSYERHA
jgi:hypothetical protein